MPERFGRPDEAIATPDEYRYEFQIIQELQCVHDHLKQPAKPLSIMNVQRVANQVQGRQEVDQSALMLSILLIYPRVVSGPCSLAVCNHTWTHG